MKVYILKAKVGESGWQNKGVFTSREKAEEAYAKHTHRPDVIWAIELWSVDGIFEWITFID